jgi:hypothetical protein
VPEAEPAEVEAPEAAADEPRQFKSPYLQGAIDIANAMRETGAREAEAEAGRAAALSAEIDANLGRIREAEQAAAAGREQAQAEAERYEIERAAHRAWQQPEISAPEAEAELELEL